METIWYQFEYNWRPILKLNVVWSNIGSNNLGLKNKFSFFVLNFQSLWSIEVFKNQNYNLSNIKEYSIIACWKAKFC